LKKIELPPRATETLFGVHDQNIKYLESLLDVRVDARGQDLTLDGGPDDVATAERIIEDFAALFREGKTFTDKELREAFAQIAEDRTYSLRDYFTKARFNPAGKKQVAPKSANQRRYIEAIQSNDIVFGIGPAGTGKSYLAVAMAVQALTQKQVSRIVLARPAVEAGERLGFLPGDLQEKVDPYLRPLYDALFDLMDAERVAKMLEKRIIEVAPLAFMRGRTLADAFIILDEAQNTTSEQMKMALTRIGFGSKAVVTGDVTQIDLPTGKRSGLVEAERILSKVEGIEFVYFNDKDVVRHRLVQQIIKAYEGWGGGGRPPPPPPPPPDANVFMVEVVNRQRKVSVDVERWREFARSALKVVPAKGAGVTVVFVSDRAMRALNRRWRGKMGTTDVLSFPAGQEEFEKGLGLSLGDVVISAEQAARQAAEHGLDFEGEVAQLVLHGLLHLCGYDHETDGGEMNALELKLRRRLGI